MRRTGVLQDELICLIGENKQLQETLTRCQAEGTALVLENRELRRRLTEHQDMTNKIMALIREG